jgi:ribonuclease P/MRP protein subunit RPP1
MESVILNERNFSRLKEQIKKLKSQEKIIIFTSEDENYTRKVLEKLPIDILLINQANRKDYSKQRNSGFNQVLAKEAKKNNIAIGINLEEIIENSGIKKAEILARIKQNIEIAKKKKLLMHFVLISKKYKKNSFELKTLGLFLGMTTEMTKQLNLF